MADNKLTEVSLSLEEKLNEISDNIKSFKDELSSLIIPLGDISSNLTKITQAFSNLSNVSNITGKAISDVSKKLIEFSRNIEAKGLIKDVSELSNQFINLHKNLFETGGAIEEARTKIANEFRQILNNIVNLQSKEITSKLSDNAIKIINSFVQDIVAVNEKSTEELYETVLLSHENLKEKITKYLTDVQKEGERQEKIANIFNIIKEKRKTLEENFENISQVLGNLNKKFSDLNFEPGIQLIKEIQEKFTNLSSILKMSSSELKAFINRTKQLTDLLKIINDLFKGISEGSVKYLLVQERLQEIMQETSKRTKAVADPLKKVIEFFSKLGNIFNTLINLSAIFTTLGSAFKIIGNLIKELWNLSKTATIFSVVILALQTLHAAFMMIANSVLDITKNLKWFGVGINNFNNLIKNWWKLSGDLVMYSVKELAEKVGSVISGGLVPHARMLDIIRGKIEGNATQFFKFSLAVDRIARSLGLSTEQLSKSFVDIATYFRINLDEIYDAGREGAYRLYKYFSYIFDEISKHIRLSVDEFLGIFGSMYDKIRWLGEGMAVSFTSYLKQVSLIISNSLKDLIKSVKDVKEVLNSILSGMESSTWDIYLGVSAAMGRLQGTVDEMIIGAVKKDPFVRMIESLRFFGEVIKNAGLPTTGLMFVGPFREILSRTPTLLPVLNRVAEELTKMRVDQVTPEKFSELLKNAGASPEQIDQLQYAVDALGDPLKKLATLVERLLGYVMGIHHLLNTFSLAKFILPR